MTTGPTSPELFRSALDLVAARLHQQHDLLHPVLADLDTNFDGEGVCGVLGVAHTTVRKVSVLHNCAPTALLSGLNVDAGPAFPQAGTNAMVLLYTMENDRAAAHDQARNLDPGFDTRPVMTVLAQVSALMIGEVGSYAGLPGTEVLTYLRAQTDWQLRAHAA